MIHPADRATAVAKVVRVVEALTEHSGVSEISRTTGLPTSTVHRIIQELVSLGWVRGDGDHGYLPGAGLLTLSAQAASDAAMSIVVPSWSTLRDATTHTVHFALRQGDQAVYVAKVEGRRAYEMRSRVGLAIPVHCTGIGKALLAALTEEEVRAILQRTGMPPTTPRTITDPDAMLEHLRTVARRGYAIDNEENELHTRCVAAVVRDHRGSSHRRNQHVRDGFRDRPATRSAGGSPGGGRRARRVAGTGLPTDGRRTRRRPADPAVSVSASCPARRARLRRTGS